LNKLDCQQQHRTNWSPRIITPTTAEEN
jgi:hypothetical protein